MKTLKSLSPSKENLSPAGFSAKHHDPVPELLAFIKAAGLKLPSHIQKLLGQDQGSVIKIISTQANPKQYQSIQKLKVRLGDSEFQLKKLEEDFAQFKLNSRLQKQRQIKKWQQSYNHLKNTLQYSNEDSSIKLIKLRQNAQRQIQILKQKHDAQLKQQNQKMTKTYQQKISSLKKLNQREIKQLKQKSQKILQSTKQRHEVQIRQLRQSNQSQIRKLCLKHKEVLDSKQKQYESTYVGLQSQKKTQQRLHQKTKIQASQAKQKLYSQLYYERNLKKDLEQIVQKRQAQIKTLKLQIHELEVDITLQKQKSEKREKQLKQSFQKQILGIEQLHKQKIADLLDSHEKQLKKYQNSVQQINQWKQNKQILMMERYQQVEFKFDERPSRQEDLDMIQKLRSKLLRKQQEVRILNKQLKNCVLESQNKQETYNRIFTCNTMNKFQKKCLNKDRQEFKSKDSLCRKSQTTDIKFLLKVYNKHI